MFEQVKHVLNQYENITCEEEISDEDVAFIQNIELHLGIAIRNELPRMAYTLGKILVDMGE